ncbi:hypothetical protein PF002_g5657 [Phytophthora fragariae]|uniref:Uncharacterized protein n=1 Tax=Phytophthora fragariae TaxID=53985 RepID=A0A6A4A3D0_9STRA|nr:hypothetical protein PF003_g24178 [Phytophthora fragariae]KAE9248700.1 hypothetical protein PF002_g5657 [Phytophthora fragariae]
MATCKLKTCRRVVKETAEASALVACSNSSCEQRIHRACLSHLLTSFDAEDSFARIVCSKRCYNAIVKSQRMAVSAQTTRKRVPWHNDGPNDNISSLSVLMNWLTSGNNYGRYRGGEGQTGETKQTLASEVVDAIAANGIATARTSKDVMTKILGLESSFRVASDWLANTGQGVENEESLREAVLQRCPTFFELYKIMDDSPSTHPLLLNTDPDFDYSDRGSETSSSEDEDVTAANEGCAVEAPSIAASRANADASSVAHESTGGVTMHAPAEVAPASLSTFSQTRKRSGGVLQSIVSGEKGKKSSSVTEMTHEKLISLKEMQQNDQKEIELKNLLIQQEELVLHRKRADEKSEKPTHVLNRP